MPPQTTTASQQAEAAAKRCARILVVDDDPAACELIYEILTAAEMNAITTTDPRQAAKRLLHDKFDAIFLDERMPELEGVELARLIRAAGLNRTTPIVMITGEQDRTLLTRAFEAGVNFFLFKPIDRNRILRLMRVSEDSIEREARRFSRVKLQCNVAIECESKRLTGTTLDISLGGLFVRSSQALPVGSSVVVKLEIRPGQAPLRFGARVVRVSGEDCMGLQIDSVNNDDHRALQEFLLPLVLAETK
ncbi:MAG TPA: response regulator [Candidatus Aquilonibacter sp.]|nr:response regulator [Candidatus Aquilonibacter sp.]